MVKKGTKKPRKLAKTDRFSLIEKALRKRTKEDLVRMILRIAKDNAVVARKLESHMDVEKPVDLLVADVSSAIDCATDFDEQMNNYNFDLDGQAYDHVRNGLSQLIKRGHLEDAQSLALKLMKDGSHQVEASDEGLMADEIRDCLRPVIRAVKAVGGDNAAQWAHKMQLADRVGFIRDHELAELRNGT